MEILDIYLHLKYLDIEILEIKEISKEIAMKVLLTGATGYVGSAIATALQFAGHSVIGTARSTATAERLQAAGIQPVPGDLTNSESLVRAAQTVDGVIHAAATNDVHMATVDQQAVAAILQALAGTDKPFVYTSGVWVMGDTAGKTLAEDAPLNPSPIVAWRPAIEAQVLAAASTGVRAVVIRPALVYGRGGGLVAMLVQSGREHGAVQVVGDGSNHWPLVHVDDLADLYVRALSSAPAGTVLIGANAEPLSLQTIVLAAAQAAGVDNHLHHLSLEEARQGMGLLADALALDQRVSAERAQTLLGWQPSAPSVLEELTQGSYAQTILAA